MESGQLNSAGAPRIDVDPRSPLGAPDRGVLRRVLVVLAVVWLVLAAGSAVGFTLQHVFDRDFALGLVPFLDLDTEASLGTWVAAMLHAACGVVSAGNALVSRRRGERWRRNWWLLAAVFGYLSLDEVATIHDRFSAPLRSAGDLSGPLYYAWVIPFVAAGLVFLAVQARFLISLGRTGRDLVLCGAVFVLGAAGIELIGSSVSAAGRHDTALYDAITIIEELLETAGVMAALYVLLSHLARVLDEYRRATSDVAAG